MKALLTLALVSTAAAAPTQCYIPSRYTISDPATFACTGVQEGYVVGGYCTTASSPINGGTAAEQTAAATAQAPLNVFGLLNATPAAFSVYMPSSAALGGCVVPAPTESWSVASTTADEAPAAVLTADTTQCPVNAGETVGTVSDGAGTGAPIGGIRGVAIRCDTENNFVATQGTAGSAPCVTPAAAATPALVITNAFFLYTNGQYLGTDGLGSTDYPLTNFNTNSDNSLICSPACEISADICNVVNGVSVQHPNLIVTGAGEVTNQCLLRSTSATATTGLTVRCIGAGSASTTTTDYTLMCNAGVLTNTYAGQCGTDDGAMTPAFVGTEAFENLPDVQTATENPIFGYETATSVRVTPFTVSNAWFTKRNWNANPFQALQNGQPIRIDVSNCNTSTTAATRAECVQRTLNWWRCEGVDFVAGSVCYAGAVQIACPTHELGFRCETSSKKGLLGLLGLLGLIPLLLLSLICFCCLCCIPRKKSTGEVHMSTFDPQPAVAAGSIAPATACYAPSIGACPAPAPIGVF